MTSPEEHMLASTDDEITIDPEATNAADANWLAELRAKARADGQSIAELLADGADDDEVTIDHRDRHDEIRRAVIESRSQDALESPPPHAPAPTPRKPLPPPVESAPPPPVPAESAALVPDVSDRTSPSGTPPRWEAPPRLSTARQSAPPALLTSASTSRRFDWRIAVAVAVAVVLGFVIAMLIPGGSTDDPVDDPSVTTVDAPPEADFDTDEEQP